MKYTMGIDIGTEGTKVLIVDQQGCIAHRAVHSYKFEVPNSGWAEQDPKLWWQSVITCANELWAEGVKPENILAVGVSGQMHSSVLLDSSGNVIRKSILWNDMRTKQICDTVLQTFGQERYQGEVCNSLLPGFTLGKILWLKENEPENYRQIAKILMPKDYINYQLTGGYTADVSDASGTGVFDVRHRDWHRGLLDELELPESWFPPVHESSDLIGTITPEASQLTGLKEGTPVIAGAADNAAAAIGMGIVTPQRGLVSVGTSGVVLSCLEQPPTEAEAVLQNPTLHVFCHALPHLWYGMGVTLAAGASLRWFRDGMGRGLSYDELMGLAGTRVRGSNGLIYLPFLAGERTPHNSEYLRAAFLGVSLQHELADFVRALIEGVSYSLKDCLELIFATTGQATELLVTGGVTNSNVWLSTLADIFGLPLYTSGYSEGASYGAALLAGLASGLWTDVLQPVTEMTELRRVDPGPDVATYDTGYRQYRKYADMLVNAAATL